MHEQSQLVEVKLGPKKGLVVFSLKLDSGLSPAFIVTWAWLDLTSTLLRFGFDRILASPGLGFDNPTNAWTSYKMEDVAIQISTFY